MEVVINGTREQFNNPINLIELLDKMKLSGRRIAVERNGAIVPRSRYAQTQLINEDRVEIVVAVGGG